MLYLVGRSIEQGRLAGFVSILGIHTATLARIVASAVGLSAVIASSALAFAIVQYAGAAYLIWLGLKKIFGRVEATREDISFTKHAHSKLFRDGFIVNFLNPKTALFFLAFLPQFVDVGRGHVAGQMIILGLVYTLIGLLTDGCYALAAGSAGNWLKRRRAYLGFKRYVSGVLFIGLGLTAAFAGNNRK